LILAASIEHEETGQTWGNETDKVRITFARNFLTDTSYAGVDFDPYHRVTVDLHNTVFNAEESFVLRVDVDQNGQTENTDACVFGCSQSIR